MSTNVLITGASGYIGGTLIKHLLADEALSGRVNLFALVRTDLQAKEVEKLGIKPLRFDLFDPEGCKAAVTENKINLVVHTANPVKFDPPKAFIDGLATVTEETGIQGHFVHTSGAKLFSAHAGVTSKEPLSDQGIFVSHKNQISPIPFAREAIQTNISTIEYAQSRSVKSYIVVPPMTYGPGEGFGNKISIQYVAIVRIGKVLGQLWQASNKQDTWALCHLLDLTDLYIRLVRAVVQPGAAAPPAGPDGIFFAESGSFNWADLSSSIANRLHQVSLVKDPVVREAGNDDYKRMGEVLRVPPELVPLQIAGFCSLRGDNARKVLGWEPKYGLDHLMATVSEEVDFILKEDV